MQECKNCQKKFEVQEGIEAAEVHEYPVKQIAKYCPFCGASQQENTQPNYAQTFEVDRSEMEYIPGLGYIPRTKRGA